MFFWFAEVGEKEVGVEEVSGGWPEFDSGKKSKLKVEKKIFGFLLNNLMLGFRFFLCSVGICSGKVVFACFRCPVVNYLVSGISPSCEVVPPLLCNQVGFQLFYY